MGGQVSVVAAPILGYLAANGGGGDVSNIRTNTPGVAGGGTGVVFQSSGYEMPRALPEDVQVAADLNARMEPILAKFTAERKVPGSIVMMARHGKVIMEQYSGYDNSNYIFRLFSQSKPITSAATMICIEDGLIGLDDPVVKYVPEFKALRVMVNGTSGATIETKPLRRQVTIRHLLTHTGGFVYGDGGDTIVDEMYRAAKVLDLWEQDLEGFINKLARIPLLTQPGTEWRYSVSFDILGAIIQRVTKKPYDLFLQERLFEPLNMKDTGFWVPPEELARLVVYWTSAAAPGVLAPVPFMYSHTDFSKKPQLLSGGGGLVSTARDYMHFAQMLLNGGELNGIRILKTESVMEMWRSQLAPSMMPFKMGTTIFKSSDFGLGMAIQNRYLPGMAVIGEMGWGGAASTNWWACPDTDTVIVTMTQVTPFFNGLAETVRPVLYTSLLDWSPPSPVIVETGAEGEIEEGVVEEEEKVDIYANNGPTDEEAAMHGMGSLDTYSPSGNLRPRPVKKGGQGGYSAAFAKKKTHMIG